MAIHRMLITGTGRTFVQDGPGADVHTQYGRIPGERIDAASDGDVITSETGEELLVYSPQWIDKYKRIKRGAQIITFKDAGVILATAGLGPESIVAEAGSGSGAMTAFLARHTKHVYSYDIEPDHLETAKQNINDLELDNVDFAQHDITTGIPDGPVDCVILDMPEPWHVFTKLDNLKIGGYIVTYTPSANQLQAVRHAAEDAGLQHIRSVEVSERHWMVRGQAVRPTSKNVAFTAFLGFFRWMGPNYRDIKPKPRPRSDGPKLPSEELMRELF